MDLSQALQPLVAEAVARTIPIYLKNNSIPIPSVKSNEMSVTETQQQIINQRQNSISPSENAVPYLVEEPNQEMKTTLCTSHLISQQDKLKTCYKSTDNASAKTCFASSGNREILNEPKPIKGRNHDDKIPQSSTNCATTTILVEGESRNEQLSKEFENLVLNENADPHLSEESCNKWAESTECEISNNSLLSELCGGYQFLSECFREELINYLNVSELKLPAAKKTYSIGEGISDYYDIRCENGLLSDLSSLDRNCIPIFELTKNCAIIGLVSSFNSLKFTFNECLVLNYINLPGSFPYNIEGKAGALINNNEISVKIIFLRHSNEIKRNVIIEVSDLAGVTPDYVGEEVYDDDSQEGLCVNYLKIFLGSDYIEELSKIISDHLKELVTQMLDSGSVLMDAVEHLLQ